MMKPPGVGAVRWGSQRDSRCGQGNRLLWVRGCSFYSLRDVAKLHQTHSLRIFYKAERIGVLVGNRINGRIHLDDIPLLA